MSLHYSIYNSKKQIKLLPESFLIKNAKRVSSLMHLANKKKRIFGRNMCEVCDKKNMYCLIVNYSKMDVKNQESSPAVHIYLTIVRTAKNYCKYDNKIINFVPI